MKKKNTLRGIRILHEDRDVIVIEKDAGILSQALRHSDEHSVEGALTDYLRKGQWKSTKRAFLVHRLDRDTSGVMMVAKNERAQQWLRDNWNEVTTKIYLARVEGSLASDSGVFESYLREDEKYFVKSVKNPQYGKFARTEWEIIKNEELRIKNEELPTTNHQPPTTNHQSPTTNHQLPTTNHQSPTTTLVKVSLKSGRKNQIRVHFSESGHPVVGDAKYGNARAGEVLCLHALQLSFKHPHTGKILSFEASVPSWAGNG